LEIVPEEGCPVGISYQPKANISYPLNNMFSFGKKKIKKPERISAGIHTIPEEFYGAKDPTIHYEQVKQIKSAKAISRIKEQKFSGKTSKLSSLVQNKKFRYIAIGISFIIIVALISWYYIRQAQIERVVVLPEVVEEVEEVKEPVVAEEVEEELVEEIQEEEIVTTTPVLDEKILEFPKLILVDTSDIDSDALTDAEEELFNTDSGTWDTDQDGYYDGQEIFNLYNPTGLAPMRLIDAGLVQEYVNPTWQYRVYYPIPWLMGEVDTMANQVLFSSILGDYVEIIVFEKDSTTTFESWFGDEAEGQNFSDLQKVTNKFQEDGWKRKDNLVAYFISSNKVYVMIYSPGSTGFIPYRHVMQMMVQSFRPTKTLINISEQEVLPSLPDFTEEIQATSSEDILEFGEISDTEENI